MKSGLFNFFRIFIRLFFIIVFFSSCSYQREIEHPVMRKFTWFSYIAATDIQKRCDRSSGLEYRFVYNGVYDEQVRTYDISHVGADRYEIKTNVSDEVDISSISLDLRRPDLFKPWRTKSSVTNVSINDIEMLTKTLKNIGFFNSSPPLRSFSSIEFYWIVSTCINGRFNQNGYFWPDEKFKTAQFPKLLHLWDFTDVPFNQPRQTSSLSALRLTGANDIRNYFNLNFNSNGLLSYNR